jgi:hypothetical protein
MEAEFIAIKDRENGCCYNELPLPQVLAGAAFSGDENGDVFEATFPMSLKTLSILGLFPII